MHLMHLEMMLLCNVNSSFTLFLQCAQSEICQQNIMQETNMRQNNLRHSTKIEISFFFYFSYFFSQLAGIKEATLKYERQVSFISDIRQENKQITTKNRPKEIHKCPTGNKNEPEERIQHWTQIVWSQNSHIYNFYFLIHKVLWNLHLMFPNICSISLIANQQSQHYKSSI
jgi:hypothetical protein